MLATLQKDYSEDVRSPGPEGRGPSFDAARILRAFCVPDDFSGSPDRGSAQYDEQTQHHECAGLRKHRGGSLHLENEVLDPTCPGTALTRRLTNGLQIKRGLATEPGNATMACGRWGLNLSRGGPQSVTRSRGHGFGVFRSE